MQISISRPLQFAFALTLFLAISTVGQASSLRRSAIVKAVSDARPAIVSIYGHKTVPNKDVGYATQGANSQRVRGMGTGVFVDPRGYILTNYHVVQGVRRINVNLSDGTPKIAKLVAHDPVTDLAIIKIDTKRKMSLIKLGSSRDLWIGEEVIAIGNAYGYEHTVTRGIISALHRSVQVDDTQKYYDLIQTDASINPGNSGGPLLNIDGEMIGVNVAVRVGAQGIGFTIPIDKAMSVAAQLLSVSKISGVQHGLVANVEDESSTQGITLASVSRNSPAGRAGLKKGDIVTHVNNLPISRSIDVERALIGKKAGTNVAVRIRRNGSENNISLQLASSRSQGSNSQDSMEEMIWSKVGLRLTELTDYEMTRLKKTARMQDNSEYEFDGGLRVLNIRNSSAAAKQGIRPGDILVGLQKWKTHSFENVAYVLKEPSVIKSNSMTFYIVRGGDTLYGQMPVTWR